VYFAPWVLSVSVVGLLWWWIFQSSGGLVNYYWEPLIGPLLKGAFLLLKFVIPPVVAILLGRAAIASMRAEGRGFSLTRPSELVPWLSIAVTLVIWFLLLQVAGPEDTPPRWLSSLPWAWISILIATVWWTIGFNMIILLAALQDIPDQLYEAA